MTYEQQNANTPDVPAVEQPQTQQPPAAPETPPGNAEQVPGQQQTQQPAGANNSPGDAAPAGNVPESADAYDIAVEGFDMEAFAAHETNKAFLDKAHGLGMSNEQMTAVIEAYEQHAAVQVEQLQQEWGNEFNVNINLAKQAIEAAGMGMDEVDSPTFGLKLAAFFGKNMQEDFPPANTQPTGAETIEQLMMSEAYSNANHPDHKSVAARVSQYFQKQFPE